MGEDCCSAESSSVVDFKPALDILSGGDWISVAVKLCEPPLDLKSKLFFIDRFSS